MKQEIESALETLRNGGVILYPTDTVWGLGCDSTNAEAVAKIAEIKARPEGKSMLVLVSDDAMLERSVAAVPDVAWQLVDFAEKPMTIVYDEGVGFAPNVCAEDGSIGIRIAKDDFCRQLIQRFRRPIISTSANLSGEPTPTSFNEISDSVKSRADYIVNLRHEDIMDTPSSILKVGLNGDIKIIRQ